MAAIVVECLRYGHCARLSEAALPDYGVKPEAPIVSLVKRLTCIEWGSRSVLAYRSEEERRKQMERSR